MTQKAHLQRLAIQADANDIGDDAVAVHAQMRPQVIAGIVVDAAMHVEDHMD